MEPEGLWHTCECVSVCVCVCMWVFEAANVCAYIRIRVYNYVVRFSVYVCMCVFVCGYGCMSVWGYVCVYMSNMNYNRWPFVIMCGGCVCVWLICVFTHVCVLVWTRCMLYEYIMCLCVQSERWCMEGVEWWLVHWRAFVIPTPMSYNATMQGMAGRRPMLN